MEINEDRELALIERWKKVFFAWALFFTLLFLVSLIIAKRTHAATGTGVVWAGLFTILYWLPGIMCRWRRLLAGSILSFGVGAAWLVRVLISFRDLVPTIRKPPAQGILAEVAMLLTSIAAAYVFLTGGIQICRTLKIAKTAPDSKQERESGNR